VSVLAQVSYEYFALLKFLRSEYYTILITGRKKSGKSALMYHLLELIHRLNPRLPVYVINFPPEKAHLLPPWVQIANKYALDRLENCVIGIEESALVAYSRNWYRSYNKMLSQLLAISAHKRQRQIFVVQNLRLLDTNIISLADALFIKPYSYTGFKSERAELQEIISRAWLLYEANNIVTLEEQRKYAVAVDIPDSPEPFLYRYELPSFWSEELSRAWAGWTFQQGEDEDKPTVKDRIRELIIKGYTKEQILRELEDYPNKRSVVTMYYQALKQLREEGIVE